MLEKISKYQLRLYFGVDNRLKDWQLKSGFKQEEE